MFIPSSMLCNFLFIPNHNENDYEALFEKSLTGLKEFEYHWQIVILVFIATKVVLYKPSNKLKLRIL